MNFRRCDEISRTHQYLVGEGSSPSLIYSPLSREQVCHNGMRQLLRQRLVTKFQVGQAAANLPHRATSEPVFPDVGPSQHPPSNSESSPEGTGAEGIPVLTQQPGLGFLRWQQRFAVRILSRSFSSAQTSLGEVPDVRGDRISPASKLLLGLKAEVFHPVGLQQ